MTPEQFCYWLQGFAELSGDSEPTPAQWKSIQEHLQTVFKKVTPPVAVFGNGDKEAIIEFPPGLRPRRDSPLTPPEVIGPLWLRDSGLPKPITLTC